MQEITVATSDAVTHATNIKNAFETYGTGYFDSITIDTESEDGYTFVRFFKGGTNLMSLRLSNTRGYDAAYQMRFVIHAANRNVAFYNGANSSSYNFGCRFQTIIFTDNAIVFKHMAYTGSSSCSYAILCKNAEGNLMLVAPYSQGYENTVLYYIQNSTNGLFTAAFSARTYDLESGSSLYASYYSSTNTNSVVAGAPFIALSAGATKNVYYALNACYRTIVEPFRYTIDGESYVGIGGNSIIVKST